jgi:hypothetical protein
MNSNEKDQETDPLWLKQQNSNYLQVIVVFLHQNLICSKKWKIISKIIQCAKLAIR